MRLQSARLRQGCEERRYSIPGNLAYVGDRVPRRGCFCPAPLRRLSRVWRRRTVCEAAFAATAIRPAGCADILPPGAPRGFRQCRCSCPCGQARRRVPGSSVGTCSIFQRMGARIFQTSIDSRERSPPPAMPATSPPVRVQENPEGHGDHALWKMLDTVSEHGNPGMLSFFVHGIVRRREFRIGECADGHGNHPRHPVGDIGHRGTAARAKPEGRARAALANHGPRAERAGHFDMVFGPAGLGGKGAPASLLAVQAMTDRHAHRVSRAFRPQLATATGCDASSHRVRLQLECWRAPYPVSDAAATFSLGATTLLKPRDCYSVEFTDPTLRAATMRKYRGPRSPETPQCRTMIVESSSPVRSASSRSAMSRHELATRIHPCWVALPSVDWAASSSASRTFSKIRSRIRHLPLSGGNIC